MPKLVQSAGVILTHNPGTDELVASVDDALLVTNAELTSAVDGHVAATDPHTGYQLKNAREVAGGYAGLDAAGLVTLTRVPRGGMYHQIFKSGQYYTSPTDTVTTATRAAGELGFIPFFVPTATPFDRFGLFVAAAGAGLVRFGIYKDDQFYPGALHATAGTVDTGTTGVKEVAITLTLQPGLYWLAMLTETTTTTTYRVQSGGSIFMPMALPTSSVPVNGYMATGVAAGAMPNPAPASLGRHGSMIRLFLRAL